MFANLIVCIFRLLSSMMNSKYLITNQYNIFLTRKFKTDLLNCQIKHLLVFNTDRCAEAARICSPKSYLEWRILLILKVYHLRTMHPSHI